MTLILAITCKDGVVFASDGQATRLINGKATKSNATKIFKLGKSILWGCAGSETFVLQFWERLSKALEDPKNHEIIDIKLKNYLETFAKETKEEAEYLYRFEQARCPEWLVARHYRHPMIWCMANKCKSIFFSKDNYDMTRCRMFSIGDGSGQIVAQALFENLKIRNCEYTLAQGSLIAYRLIKEAIKSSPEIGDPIDIWTIKDNVVKQKTRKELEKLNKRFDIWVDEEQGVSENILSSLR